MKTLRHRRGSASPRPLARDLVALLEHDMQYLGWFVAIARAYPDDAPSMDWPRAMEVARASRMPLQVAEAILRSSRHFPRRGPVGPWQNRHR